MRRIDKLLDGRVTLHCADCLSVLATLPENSIDACVTDPPYGLSFMGKAWDHGVPGVEYWQAVYRVLKPGAHLLAFGGMRTYHRLACAIEDAGFEVRDMVSWLYGSGFPKSLDVSKQLDRATGAEREVIGPGTRHNSKRCAVAHGDTERLAGGVPLITAPSTYAAKQWDGFGTALKPAFEPIVLARKPLSERTVAANVLRWGTGAINVDGCRVASEGGTDRIGEDSQDRRYTKNGSTNFSATPGPRGGSPNGRWPANVIHDGSEEVVGMFPDVHGAGYQTDGAHCAGTKPSGMKHGGSCYGSIGPRNVPRIGDSGSAARFFYSAKADADDRLGSKHPTVKPLDLMQYLCRLVTPPKGLVIDPFAGTGTTGEAAWREGFRAILVEREDEYQDDIRRRMRLAMAGPDERGREAIKAKLKDKAIDAGPLFEFP